MNNIPTQVQVEFSRRTSRKTVQNIDSTSFLQVSQKNHESEKKTRKTKMRQENRKIIFSLAHNLNDRNKCIVVVLSRVTVVSDRVYQIKSRAARGLTSWRYSVCIVVRFSLVLLTS